ncbi:MAG: Serine phosphatase RsbU, regulator of sigma subunit [uncultured Solirubrobacteraceae bacterium]|uniref:Serine phosphatase RsbU, regulator of sigma subunit n=1 Tax=uncultured Solirubrobacteraceae bacterium TaxID=1162706 RepID=A0A6J4SF07_9ACTN|nr:MAG: Serine phosphatase RsbU, regulator of sigma subunit [uncultured Solirubrobacteraceae bacterium]
MTLPENSTAPGADSSSAGAVPTSFDHVALWVADRGPIVDLLCGHLGMHVIDATDAFSLVGADARRGKITLFDAPGPRDPGVLGRVALRVADLDAALAALPDDLAVERDGDEARFEAREGLRLALVEVPGTDVDYDLDHVTLRVSDVGQVAEGLARLGLERHGDRLTVAGKEIRLEGGGAREGDRPLLNHLAVLVDSAAEAEAGARRRGDEIAAVVDAANTLAVFVWGPDRIKLEYVEHKPGFALA